MLHVNGDIIYLHQYISASYITCPIIGAQQIFVEVMQNGSFYRNRKK